jgi:hypothetical protein
MINNINWALKSRFEASGMGQKIFAKGASDMEVDTGFVGPDNTSAWLKGYLHTAEYPLVDFGNTNCIIPANICGDNYDWTVDQVREKAWGDGRVRVVPQIYHGPEKGFPNGRDANQWVELWDYARKGAKPITISGVLTQSGSCSQGYDCDGADNTPEEAWEYLQNEFRAKGSEWTDARWLTDIRHFKSSANPPWLDLVNMTSQIQKKATDGKVTITWEAGDPDGDTLFYEILYMPNDTRVITLGTVSHNSMTINLSELPGSSAARIMVVANDSFHFTTATSEPFAVAPKPPTVNILAPASEAVLPPGQSVQLLGYAEDPEDGILPDAALSWYSNRDGFLGTGGQVLVTLSYGQHVITLRTIDSDGNTATASVNVFVGSRIYLPVIQKEFEGISPPNIYLPIILR